MRKLFLFLSGILAASSVYATGSFVSYIPSTNTLQSSSVVNIASGTISTFTAQIGAFAADNAANDVDATVYIARNVDTRVSSTNCHGFSEGSRINRPGTIGYNSYDSRIISTGSYSYDHFAGFQFLPTFNSTGTINNTYGLFTGGTNNAATITDARGVSVANWQSTGVITSLYGVFVDTLTRGSSNWGFFSAGQSVPNYFGGKVYVATGIAGTTTNDNAAAGNYGEYISSKTTAISVGATDTLFDVVSATLTAGDWDLSGICSYRRNSAVITGATQNELGISATPNNSSTGLVEGDNYVINTDTITLWTIKGMSIPPVRVSISATTVYYLKGRVFNYSSTVPTVAGRLSARRVR